MAQMHTKDGQNVLAEKVAQGLYRIWYLSGSVASHLCDGLLLNAGWRK